MSKFKSVTDEELAEIRGLIKWVAPGSRVITFGSRCKGTARKDSDLDIAVDDGGVRMSAAKFWKVKQAFSIADLWVITDITDYNAVKPWFKEEIDKNCEILYPPESGEV
jgi:predicted nucleotidyltransferase